MIPIILITVAALLVLFLLIVSSRPSSFRVVRSQLISAAPGVVFAEVNNLHRWQAWSPWAKVDPNAKITFDGPQDGVGSAQSWDGKGNVGAGRMTITESHPVDLIRFRLDFLRPFKGTNMAEFTFEPQVNATLVSWSMSGKYNFLMRAIGLFMNCDKMVGGQFEKGLADLKTVAESASRI